LGLRVHQSELLQQQYAVHAFGQFLIQQLQQFAGHAVFELFLQQ
jgi:hypothetical protein